MSKMKLFAIVDDGHMNGDSEFSADSYVEYKKGMTLKDIRLAYAETEICQDFETDVKKIKVAWVVNQKIMKILDKVVTPCHNDGQVYAMNHMLKKMAKTLCIKEIKK